MVAPYPHHLGLAFLRCLQPGDGHNLDTAPDLESSRYCTRSRSTSSCLNRVWTDPEPLPCLRYFLAALEHNLGRAPDPESSRYCTRSRSTSSCLNRVWTDPELLPCPRYFLAALEHNLRRRRTLSHRV